ncbi:MAG: Flp pilus assembly protein CpaB [Bdellovibrionales bacterium]|nr:Flp pilus assembly protein CpaB [Bdellovibrionales bacterium]
MKNRRALLFAVIFGATSVFALMLYVSKIEQKYQGAFQPISILVASKDIRQHEIIDETMFEVRQVPKPYVQPLATPSQELGQVVGYVAATSIKKGEQLLKTKLSLPGESGISPIIPKESRACTIAVNAITGVGGHIRNGDTVDVIGVFRTMDQDRKGIKDLEAVTLFQNVPVLATGANYQLDRFMPSSSTNSPLFASQNSRSGFSNITLQVSPRTCMDLAIAQETGTLSLALRSYHDRFTANEEKSLKTNRSTTESVTGIKVPIEIRQKPKWLELRGEEATLAP